MKKTALALLAWLVCLPFLPSVAQNHVTVTVKADGVSRPVSPLIYGKNNCLSKQPSDPLSAAEWQRLRDLGITLLRENGGNNATKYNWRRKLSSHPDWYNNVYFQDWDYAAKSQQANLPGTHAMWAFQLVGKAAKTTSVNFNDWDYNHSNWWSGCGQNLCGGGQVNPAGGNDALVEGNPDLYLENWNADSTTAILNHWFGGNGIGLDPGTLQYWSMDNEPEIWEGTHDDVYPVQPDAETFIQTYIEVAKKARARYPGIKLTGPVPANEWQWYNWKGNKISYNSKSYVWLEYFILRLAEEQQKSGIRLLDVLDIHFYPEVTSPVDIVQLHRVFFDSTYIYPNANGVKRSGSSAWDNSLNREYIFKRCNAWLDKYMGYGHGVTLSVSETGINSNDPNVTAVWYASMLGEFARRGVEIFTPWSWKTGMDEVVHLFSRYGNKEYLEGQSSEELVLSAYPTLNAGRDSMTLYLVNRHTTASRIADINLSGFSFRDGTYKLYSLSSLPASETFFSHSQNALQVSSVTLTGGNASVLLPPMSVSALVVVPAPRITNSFGTQIDAAEAEQGTLTGVTVAATANGFSGTGYVTGFDNTGDKVAVNVTVPNAGAYRVVIRYRGAYGDKVQDVTVNGGFASPVQFAACDTFNSVDAGTYLFTEGTNTVALVKNWGWIEIDRFEIYRGERNVYHIVPVLVDTASTMQADSLYDFLRLQFGERIISGQTHDYYNEISALTGQAPLLRAGDLQHYTEGYPYLWKNGGFAFGKEDDGTVQALIDWYRETNRKGIVSLHWHWHSPTGGSAGTNTFYTQYTTFDVTRAVTPGTQEYTDIIRDIDEIATQLKRFQDAGVPVLWRPLHEAGGGWFWWGARGPEACLTLYNMLYDRLTNFHRLHNLIWVWSTPETDWYPGNDRVDIVGYDSYPGAFNYGAQKAAFDVLYRLTGGEKLIALSENGPIPDPDACLLSDAPWLYFMSWSTMVTQQNAGDHLLDVYENPVVLRLGSDNVITTYNWRSALYPENWYPGYTDTDGRFLHDFSWAGVQDSTFSLPSRIVDVTQPPYLADNTGATDVTTVLQQALDETGAAGGGVVYLPAGTYRVSAQYDGRPVLKIAKDSTVLRGAGAGNTFLLNTTPLLRNTSILEISGKNNDWLIPSGSNSLIAVDLPEGTRVIPVLSVSGFVRGDRVILHSAPTDDFIEEHGMSAHWTAASFGGVTFCRTIDSVDSHNNLLFLDTPVRYPLKKRDHARVYHAGTPIQFSGVENLSVGNVQNPHSGWADDSWSVPGSGAYEVDSSWVIRIRHAENCRVKGVSTYRPSENGSNVHLLSNGIGVFQSRFVTIDSCSVEYPQYTGSGQNGDLAVIESNDILVSRSRFAHGRHGITFRHPWSNGNTVLQCRMEYSRYGNGFQGFLSMANLFDACTLQEDYLESVFLPSGSPTRGHSSSQSVWYNTTGEAYHPNRSLLVDSRQFGHGYVIGTSGPADAVTTVPADGTINGFPFHTLPVDFSEGIGKGARLEPVSLYLDQLQRRKSRTVLPLYQVTLIVKDKETGAVLPGVTAKLFRDSLSTDGSGKVVFSRVPEFFSLSLSKPLYLTPEPALYEIRSDTTLQLTLSRQVAHVSFHIVNKNTGKPLSGASVSLGDQEAATGATGLVSFTVDGGMTPYSIAKNYFLAESDSIFVSIDTTLRIELVQLQADVKFRLNRGDTPVGDVQVTFGNDTLMSTNLGVALFKSVPVLASYAYTVSKEGYTPLSGEFYLRSDTAVNLTMSYLPTGFADAPGMSFSCWPNPASDYLHCQVEGDIRGMKLSMADMSGHTMLQVAILDRACTIPVSHFPSGAYILQLEKDGRYFRRIVILGSDQNK